MSSRILYRHQHCIDRSHPIGNQKQQSQDAGFYASATQKKKTLPIIVKLRSYKFKHQLMTNQQKQKGSGIVIITNCDLLYQTSKHKHASASWSVDGKIFAIVKFFFKFLQYWNGHVSSHKEQNTYSHLFLFSF